VAKAGVARSECISGFFIDGLTQKGESEMITVDQAGLQTFLKKANIDGVVNSIMMRIEDGKIKTRAIDESNTILLLLSKDIEATGDAEMRTNDLSLLRRLLSSVLVGGGEKEKPVFGLKLDGEKKLTVTYKKRKQFSFSLSSKESVVEIEGDIDAKFAKLKKACTIKLSPDIEFVREFVAKAPLIEANAATFHFTPKTSRVIFVDTLGNEIYIKVAANWIESKLKGEKRDLTVTFFPKMITGVLSVLNDEDLEKCKLYFIDEKSPVVISVADGEYAIAPLVTEE